MSKIICLDLKSTLNESIKINGNSNFLFPISKYNIFIGENNSGKSLLLRNIFSQKAENKKYFILNNMEKKYDNIEQYINTYLMPNIKTHVSETDAIEFTKQIGTIDDIFKKYELLTKYKDLKYVNENSRDWGLHEDDEVKVNYFRTRIHEFESHLLSQFENENQLSTKINYFYFTLERTLRPLDSSFDNTIGKFIFTNKDLIKDRTIHEYFLPQKGSIEPNIYSGIGFFEDIHKLICGNESERNVIIEFEKFLSNSVFDGTPITLIPKYNSKFVELKLGTENQFPIYKIGDGVQSLVIILFYVFLNKESTCFHFIEEPECHMHPNLQRKLMIALNNEIFHRNTYFFSTHSNIFINNEKTSIFKFLRKNNQSIVNYIFLKRSISETLSELGYKNSDLLQANYILWVEGPSDKIYLEKLMFQLDNTLRPGIDFQILIFGGSNGVHLFKEDVENGFETINSINPNFGIFIDSDRKSGTDKIDLWKSEVKKLCDKYFKYCFITLKREIENYIEFNSFVNCVKNIRNNGNIEVLNGPFLDRFAIIDNSSVKKIKKHLEIPDELYNRMQSQDFDIKKCPPKMFKMLFIEHLKNNTSNTGGLRKVLVAKNLVKNELLVETELQDEILKLIIKIKEAN